MSNDLLVLVVREAICSCIISPVKTTYFIRTVVGTISCTNASVIGHLVQTFGTMVGSSNRANVLTWRVITMLAHQRLEHHIRVLKITTVVTIYTHPLHIMETCHFTLAHYRNIV